jgi:hypothetical protein
VLVLWQARFRDKRRQTNDSITSAPSRWAAQIGSKIFNHFAKADNTEKGHRYVDYRPDSLNSKSAVKIERTLRVTAVPIKPYDDGWYPFGIGALAAAQASAQTTQQTTAAALYDDTASADDPTNFLLSW